MVAMCKTTSYDDVFANGYELGFECREVKAKEENEEKIKDFAQMVAMDFIECTACPIYEECKERTYGCCEEKLVEYYKKYWEKE